MREVEFEDFLSADSNIVSKIKAVRSRVSKVRMIESYFNTSLDYIVEDDDLMYKLLIDIKKEMKDTNGNISSALTKYYQFVNGKTFHNLAGYRHSDRIEV